MQPTVLPGGLFIPQGTSIVLSTISMQRSKLYWGEDADLFRPERMKDESTLRARFRAFNIGPRQVSLHLFVGLIGRDGVTDRYQCPGQNMAMSVAKIWLETVTEYLTTRDLSLSLAKEAQPVLSRVPEWWSGPQGDGRGRGGREAIWPVSDIILTVKVSPNTVSTR